MTTVVISEKQQRLENEHIEWVRNWAALIANWTLAAKKLREEREALETDLSKEAARMVLDLLTFGYSLPDAEKRVEELLHDAFRIYPA